MRVKLVCFGLVFLSLSPDVWTATRDDEESLSGLSREDAIQRALENAPAIRQAEAAVAMERFNVKATDWWRSLIGAIQVSLNSGYSPVLGESRFYVGLGVEPKSVVTARSEHAQAKLRLFDAEIYMESVRTRLALEAAQAFAEWREAVERVALGEEALTETTRIYEIGKVRFELGQIQLDELLRLNQQIRVDTFALFHAKSERFLKAMALQQLIGVHQ